MSLQYYHVINAKVENNNDKMMEVTMIKISNFFFFFCFCYYATQQNLKVIVTLENVINIKYCNILKEIGNSRDRKRFCTDRYIDNVHFSETKGS